MRTSRIAVAAGTRECSHPRARRRAPAGAIFPPWHTKVLDVIRAAGREVRIAHLARALGLTPGDAGKLLNDLADHPRRRARQRQTSGAGGVDRRAGPHSTF